MSENTSKSQYSRARSYLKKKLEEQVKLAEKKLVEAERNAAIQKENIN